MKTGLRARSAWASAVLVGTLLATTAAMAEPGSGGVNPDGGGGGDEGRSAGDGSGTFPINGRYTYGDGIGAGRGHQGQDIMAKCGKPVVAAMDGRVRLVDYQGNGAGNFVVVKGKDPRYDYVYMHMLERVAVEEGERVAAGDRIGSVGSTGRSTACHLHFEMWTPPGWYRGGELTNPRPFLRSWGRRG